jgi:hypothetical protein
MFDERARGGAEPEASGQAECGQREHQQPGALRPGPSGAFPAPPFEQHARVVQQHRIEERLTTSHNHVMWQVNNDTSPALAPPGRRRATARPAEVQTERMAAR